MGHVRDIGTAPATSPTPAPAESAAPLERGIGVVVPYDFALDRELWRWCPAGATLHLTRTPHLPLPVGLAQARAVRAPGAVAQATHDLSTVRPGVVAYACTSGSFVAGVPGERALRTAIVAAGAPAAVTTSGAAAEALHTLGTRRVVVVTPYDESVTERLGRFLTQAGIEVAAAGHLGLVGGIWTVPERVTADLVRATVCPGAEAVFVSCTNLRTYDVLAPLEAELGIPVLSANQVTLWQALATVGLRGVGPGQSLLGHTPRAGTPPGSDDADPCETP